MGKVSLLREGAVDELVSLLWGCIAGSMDGRGEEEEVQEVVCRALSAFLHVEGGTGRDPSAKRLMLQVRSYSR